MNPARSISQAIFASDYLSQVWLFIAAPIAGGQLAGLVYPWLTEKE